HMASVRVPFTSESKEALADYDEIRKEIKLARQECGRRLGVFLRRRERAKSEFRRRNIFELYIEEVVEACARLKGGKLGKDKLKAQLLKIAAKRTGGAKTDEILGRDGGGPGGLPHSVIVTPQGPEGGAPVLPSPVAETSAPATAGTEAPAAEGKPAKGKSKAGASHAPAGKHSRASARHAPAAKHDRAAAAKKRKHR